MEDNESEEYKEIETCFVYLGEKQKVCKACKTLNNSENTICVNCEVKLKRR